MVINSYKYGYQVQWKYTRQMTTIHNKLANLAMYSEDITRWREDIENITRWREDMNFMFEWQEQYLTSERCERVRYCSCHENIKFISSS